MASRYEISTIFKMIDNFSGPMKSISTSSSVMAKKISADMQRTRMQMKAAGEAAKQMAGIAIAAGAALAGKAIADSVQTYIEFEDAVTKAGTKFKDLDVTSESYNDTLEKMQEKAREVGAVTKFSAVDAAGALDKMAMAGLTSEQAMGMLMGTTNLAASVGLDLTTAVDMATDAMGAFNLVSEDQNEISANMNRIADVVARTTNMANTDMSMWFEAVKNGAPQFTALGGDIETFSASIGILANSGIKGGEAGTALRNIMLRLSAPAKAGADAMKELGITAFDSEGKMLPFIDIMRQFEGALDGVADEKKASLLSDIFGARAIGSFQVLMSAGTEELMKFTDALYDAGGAAETMAQAQMRSFSGMIEQLKSAYQDKQLSLGKAFEAGGAREALENLIAYVQNFDIVPIAGALTILMENIPGIVEGFVGFVQTLWNMKDIILSLIAAWGTYKIAIIGALAIEKVVAFVTAVKAVQMATEGMTVAQAGLNVVMNANPVGLIVTAVVALGVAIYEIIKHWDTVKAILEEFRPLIMIIIGPVGMLVNMIYEIVHNFENIKNAFTDGGIIQGLKVLGGTILSSILSPLQKVMEVMSKIPVIGERFGIIGSDIADFRSRALTGGIGPSESVTSPVTQGERTAYSVTETNNNTSTEVTVTLDKGLKGSISGNHPNVTLQTTSSAAWK